MNATSWATLWVFVSLIVFLGILVTMRIPAMAAKALDARGEKIRAELAEAKRLREEAEALLKDYQRRRVEAEAEAEAIVTQAGREAEALAAEARTRIEDYIARRTKAVEARIAQAQTQAIAEVRSRAIDVATSAAARILGDEAKGQTGDTLIERSIASVRKNLN